MKKVISEKKREKSDQWKTNWEKAINEKNWKKWSMKKG